MPRCLKCDKQNREGARFCEECGARLTNPTTLVTISRGAEGALVCPVCRLQNAPHMNFCRRCGGKLPKGEARAAQAGAPPLVPVVLGPAGITAPPPAVAVLMPQDAVPAAAPARYTCISCGGLTPGGYAFCQLCGARFEGAAAPAAPATPGASAASAAPVASGALRRESPRPSVSRPTPIGVPSTAPQVGSGGAPSHIRLVSIQRDGSDGEANEFVAEQVAVGRREGQVVFPADPYLADRHARLERRNGRWHVVDLGTRNGTFSRVRAPTVLGASEVLLVGKQVMAFDFLPSDPNSGQAAEEHGVVLFGTPTQAAWGRLRQISMSGIARDVYYLYRAEMALGREDGDILFPDDEFMSRCHVVLQQQGGVVTLVDQASSNGTYLRVRGEREIADGDMIRLGDQLLRLEIA